MKNVRFLDIKQLNERRIQLVYEAEHPDHPGVYTEFSVKTNHSPSVEFMQKWIALIPHALQACELMPSTAAWNDKIIPPSHGESEEMDGEMVNLVSLTEIKWTYSKDGDEIPSVQFFCEMKMKRADDMFAFKTPFKPEVARTALQEMTCLDPDAQLAILKVVTCAEKYIFAVYSQMEMRFDAGVNIEMVVDSDGGTHVDGVKVNFEKGGMSVAGGES